jgi:hypothetical protein
MTGGSAEQVSRLLRELEDSGVFSRTEHGTIYSRRMIRDDWKRAACREAGKKGGGNPSFHETKELRRTFKGQSKGESKEDSNPSSSISSSASSLKHTPLPLEGGAEEEDMFPLFWECYPLKVKKPKALAAFLKLKPDRMLLDCMLEEIERQKQSRAWRKNNGQFIPHPATWLNNREWEDSVEPDMPEESVWDESIDKTDEEKS